MTGQKTERTLISPFAGGPWTAKGEDERGNLSFTVMPREMTPERLKWYKDLVVVLAFGFFGGGLYLWARTPAHALSTLAVALGVAAVGFIAVSAWLYEELLMQTLVVFTPTEFRILRKNGWIVYDRTLTHKFVMLRHDKTREESERRDMHMRRAAQNGHVVNPPRYFSDSFHIVFEYMGHRHDVLDVYDKNRALAVLARFKACDDVMDNFARMGEGEVLHPSGQWGEQPGDLPS